MATFDIVKTINGQRNGKVVATANDIDYARELLANELQYAGGDDWNYFGCREDAEAEINFAEEARESWGDSRVDNYVNALLEGIASKAPFIANSVDGECVTIEGDRFSFDNYTVEIVES